MRLFRFKPLLADRATKCRRSHRDDFLQYLLYFPRNNLFAVEQIIFFRYLFVEQIPFLQGIRFLMEHMLSYEFLIIKWYETIEFSRSVYFPAKQIFSRKPSVHRKKRFSRSSYSIESYPLLSNRHVRNRSQWLLSKMITIKFSTYRVFYIIYCYAIYLSLPLFL